METASQSSSTPHMARRVERRRGLRARKAFPNKPRIELFRLWRGVQEARPRLREDPGWKGALIVEGSPRLKAIDPPNIRAEGLTGSKVKKLRLASEVETLY